MTLALSLTAARSIAVLTARNDGPAPAPTPSVSTDPSCLQASDLCHRVYLWTGQPWIAESSYYFLVKPLQILLIVILAILARFLIHRTIRKLVDSTANGSVPARLRPLRRRIAVGSSSGPGALPERRRQRAEAIGSILLSSATVGVYTLAALLALGQLGFSLGPLLASAGVAGVAIGFGAQSLVKDVIAGLFMLLEDQYGVGDVVDVGDTVGTVEGIGLRVTTIRDIRGVLWYIRNGEIIKVGNKSQGWATIIVDMPIGYARVDQATSVLREASAALAAEPDFADFFIEQPEVIGVEQITMDGAVLRTTAKVPSDDGPRITRELRRRQTDALEAAGVSARMAAVRFPRPAEPDPAEWPSP